MTIETDIIAVLEERRPRMAIDIARALPAHNSGSVIAVCSAMVKRGALVKVGAKLDLPPADHKPVDPASWKAEGLAPFQRVKAYIERHGPVKRHALLTMLIACGVENGADVLWEMIREGDIHAENDRFRLGPHPNAPTERTQDRTWNNRLPPRDTPKAKTPPAAVTVEQDEEAHAETRPEISLTEDMRDMLEASVVRGREELEEALGLPPSSLLDAHTLLEAPADPPRGARVLVEGVDLSIEISGSRDAVLRVLRTVNLGELFQ